MSRKSILSALFTYLLCLTVAGVLGLGGSQPAFADGTGGDPPHNSNDSVPNPSGGLDYESGTSYTEETAVLTVEEEEDDFSLLSWDYVKTMIYLF